MGTGRHVALLRGVNVGGKNRLPMAVLAGMFEEAGCRCVRTYIQSGNVVFEAPSRVAKDAAGAVEGMLLERLGLRIPVVVRSAAELRAVIAGRPFKGGDEADLHVMFLAGRPSAARGGALDPGRSPGDEFVLAGREIYLHLPNGAARSKLTNAYFDSTLGTVSTGRNWRTVLKLAEMCGAGG